MFPKYKFSNKELLNYKGVVIRVSDLATLKDFSFLNDQIICFFFTYLTTLVNSDDILLLEPSLSFWLTSSSEADPESVQEFVKPLSFSTKKLILFPVNNCDDQETGDNGSHWSLLVFYRDMHQFIHYDSVIGLNNPHAMRLYEVVKGFVGAGSSSCSHSDSSLVNGDQQSSCSNSDSSLVNGDQQSTCSNSVLNGDQQSTCSNSVSSLVTGNQQSTCSNSGSSLVNGDGQYTRSNSDSSMVNGDQQSTDSAAAAVPGFKECRKTPQQTNWYDCGLYVMAIARVICEWHADKSEPREDNWCSLMEERVDSSLEVTMRTEVIKLIRSLKDKEVSQRKENS